MNIVRAESVDAIKWLALACMVVDHVGTIFFGGDLPALNAVGRVAMPAFALALGFNLARLGAMHSGVFRRALLRMLVIGLIALPFHVAAFDSGLFNLNIMFTFAAAVAVIWMGEEAREGGAQWMIAAAVVFLIAGRFVEYWWFGIAIVVCAYVFFRTRSVPVAFALVASVAALAYVNGTHWGLLSLPIAAFLTWRDVRLPRMQSAFYFFYPAHLATFALLAWMAHL